MSKCTIYDDPKHHCNGYPSRCEGCDWREGAAAPAPAVMWHRAKAGRSLGKDAIVVYDGDPDARLERVSMVKCAIHDCKYIYVEDLLKLPVENETE